MLGADDIYRYLQGEDLTGTQTGWLRVGFHDISAGWVKGIHGMYKNHYPKNLRAVLAKQAAGTMW